MLSSYYPKRVECQRRSDAFISVRILLPQSREVTVMEASVPPLSGLGGRIRASRADLSQQEFGDRLSTSAQTIGRYEREERSPDVAFVRALIDRFGIDPRWLVTGEGEMVVSGPAPAVA